MDLTILVFFPMVMALIAFAVGRKNEALRDRVAIGTGLLTLGVAVFTVLQPDHALTLPLMAGLKLELDGFRKVYIAVIALMWAMTLLLSPQYFRHHHNQNRYYFFNLMTLGATMGVFLGADLYTAFVFFEIMSFTSFTWVMQEETPGATKAALTYLAVAVIGGLVALMGLFLVSFKLGTTEISKLYELAAACPDKKTLYIAGGCILFGFGAKAGMFPLHIWLPKAHPVAPAPASALLSGVLTKSGIWGILAISCNIFRHDPAWGTLILTLGTVTMVLGAVLALFSIDLKRTLACSSMSQIGFILVGIGMMGLLGEENALAARGTLLHMVNHSMFKLVLFECAGVVYMNLHKLDLNEIRGFGRKKPVLNFAFLMGYLGIGGIPLLNGYVSKTLLHEAIVEGVPHYGPALSVVEWLFLISGGMTLAYMTKLYVCLFVEKNADPKRQQAFDENKRYMTPASFIALAVPAVLLPVLGLTANTTMNGIADLGTDFFHAGHLEHAVHYLSLANLKGAAISVAIGAALYFLFIRKVLMKNGAYVDRWPKKLDLEELVYRPLLTKVLPGVGGAFAALFGENRITTPLAKGTLRVSGILGRIACDLPDALILLVGKVFYKPSRWYEQDTVRDSLPYRLGLEVDTFAWRLGKEQHGKHRYAHLFYRTMHTVRDVTTRLTSNISFAFLMLCGAICLIFIYMLIWRA
ncbi:MAG: complex I subunit 5 family protein [Clostridia bacterium]|nr:complex I subunit 5 family protein [Clostridia bacterium]